MHPPGYDTIQYIYVRSNADKMGSLMHGIETKKLGKLNNRVAQKERFGQWSAKAV